MGVGKCRIQNFCYLHISNNNQILFRSLQLLIAISFLFKMEDTTRRSALVDSGCKPANTYAHKLGQDLHLSRPVTCHLLAMQKTHMSNAVCAPF